eukprot:3662020-Pleurochrysis_carterae.AAC.2
MFIWFQFNSFSTTNLHVRTRLVCPRETEPPSTLQSAYYSLVFTLQIATARLLTHYLPTMRARCRCAKYTTFLVSPGLALKLAHLESLRCTHTSHTRQCGGTRSHRAWTSTSFSAFPPDPNLVIARAIASLRQRASDSLGAPPIATPQQAPPTATPQPLPAAPSSPTHGPVLPSPEVMTNPSSAPPPSGERTTRADAERRNEHFQRGLGLTRCALLDLPPCSSRVDTVHSTFVPIVSAVTGARSPPRRFLRTRERESRPWRTTRQVGRPPNGRRSPTTTPTAAGR